MISLWHLLVLQQCCWRVQSLLGCDTMSLNKQFSMFQTSQCLPHVGQAVKNCLTLKVKALESSKMWGISCLLTLSHPSRHDPHCCRATILQPQDISWGHKLETLTDVLLLLQILPASVTWQQTLGRVSGRWVRMDSHREPKIPSVNSLVKWFSRELATTVTSYFYDDILSLSLSLSPPSPSLLSIQF